MRSKTLTSVTIGGVAFAVAAASALAQQLQPAERPAATKSAPPQGNLPLAAPIIFESEKGGGRSTWVKVCQKNAAPNSKESCIVNNETIETNTGLPIIVAGVRKIEGEAKEQLVVQSALLALPAGVRVNVDGGEPVLLVYSSCYGMTCEAQGELSKELLGKLRQGKQMTVTFNLPGRTLALRLDLAGFAKAYDGSSMDFAEYAEARARLIQAMQQRQAEFAAQAKASQASSSPSMGEGPSPSQPQPVYPEGAPQ